MESDKYQLLASRTINQGLSKDEILMHALFGMASEVGEVLGIYQKAYQGHDIQHEQEHAKKEVGDLLWFIAEYCTINGWSLSDVMDLNIQKLKDRYPLGFEVGKSINRAEGDI